MRANRSVDKYVTRRAILAGIGQPLPTHEHFAKHGRNFVQLLCFSQGIISPPTF